ncbi:hypothetical protein Q4561_12960 [Alteromonas sp. 1_MG-2023]|jgi:glutathione synthase/RimK-type ligase-like ATP-grasp enzyme|uniref:ATP-grasp domain-containing protein n=1 Tax=Alteromonas sp. 1_MG-2023 TaxID=3062669 RepID=UPI0026E281A0|nr:hypothetical protein [Alteromonas sp. 1_MG-2023]MDO6567975.1 hypothetical protein [Alteromonas sp. 1_MG-2023]
MQIALVGSETDPQISHIAAVLHASNHEPHIINTSYFGERWQLSYDPDFNDGLLHFNQPTSNGLYHVPLSDIKSAYWHQYIPPTVNASDTASTQWLDQEYASTLLCWFLYNGTKWVNGIEAIRAHHCKPIQLRMAKRLGANVPYTYVGNAADIALQFCANMQELVYKPVKGGETAKLFRKGQSSIDLAYNLLKERPVTFQAYIEGTNIRTFVIGKEVVSVQIDSHNVDFREDEDARPVLVSLPKAMQKLSRKICTGLGMHWCAIDWRKNTKGEYYFLEANPCPFFLFVESETGVDITGRLVKLLTT